MALRRNLQHDRPLTFAEFGEKNHLPKLKGIVVRIQLELIYVPKDRRSLPHVLGKKPASDPDILVKGQFCARTHANRHTWLADCAKPPAGGPTETGSDQSVTDLCGTRRNSMQAIVAHSWTSLKQMPAERLARFFVPGRRVEN